MKEIITVDVPRLGHELGVPEVEFTPPVPGAKPMMQQIWSTEWVEKIIDALKKYKEEGSRVSLFGHLDTWVCMAITDALQPECECFFSTPNHDPEDTFTDLPIYEVKYGTPDPALKYRHTVREDGDFLFVDFDIDENLDWNYLVTDVVRDLTIPDIPEGKILCAYSSAKYPLQWVVLNNYAKKCRALFCAGHTDAEYHCAIPGDTGYHLGDGIPRK